jgi:hypothetical protein
MILATNAARRNYVSGPGTGGASPGYNRAMRTALLLVAAVSGLAGGDRVSPILARVSEEAETFRSTAPKTLAQEKLTQRALNTPPRFRPRSGHTALAPPQPQYRTREVVSEYGFSALKNRPGALHEFRQVISVDGLRVASEEKARQRLVAGLRSEDDREKQRLLEDFEQYGLEGAATDFGQVLLLFTRRRLPDYKFAWARHARLGEERVAVLRFKQIGGSGSLTILEQRKMEHEPLEGELWVREKDSLPLRIVLRSERRDIAGLVRDEATVDYIRTSFGYLAPLSVTHSETEDERVLVENRYEYSAFRVFTAASDIQFSPQ